MTRSIASIALLAGALTMTACAASEPAAPVHDMAADLAAITQVRDGYAAAFKAVDAAGIAALFEADGQMMEAGLPTATGTAAIEAAMKTAFGMMTRGDTIITPEKTDVVGDLAYEVGTFKSTATMTGGEMMTDEGRYLVVLRRQADGSWKLVATIGNSPTMPAMPMPAGGTSK